MNGSTPPRRLLDHMRDAIRLKHYSYRTEQSYVQWIRRYILFHNKRHPDFIGVPEIEAFLTHLAIQALNWRSCDFGQLTDQSLKQQGIQVVHHLD